MSSSTADIRTNSTVDICRYVAFIYRIKNIINDLMSAACMLVINRMIIYNHVRIYGGGVHYCTGCTRCNCLGNIKVKAFLASEW